MSQQEQPTENTEEQSTEAEGGQFDPSKYTTTHGTTPREIDTSDESHPLKQELGADEHREFKYDPKVTGSRFAFRYDDASASIREYLANAETACIRRAHRELVDSGVDESEVEEMGVDEMLAEAREVADYSPIIEVYHAHHQSDLPDLVIADNGIGISVEEFQVLEHVGMSASHDEGDVLGQFGQGVMSGFLLVGEYGEFELLTKSRNDDSSYRERVRIDGFNDLSGKRERYGTTFTFPSFTNEALDMDVQDDIERLTRGMQVPVLYQEFDMSGEEIKNEDYAPTKLSERFADDENPAVSYEDDAVEAVGSKTLSSWRNDTRTYLVSMPIRRNNSQRFKLPWKFDLRLKYEDGRIYECNCDDKDHEGLVPIEKGAYRRLPNYRRENYVIRGELGEDDVEMPTPVDDRDRLKSGYEDFYETVSEKLLDELETHVTETLEEITSDGLEVLFNKPRREQALFFEGYQELAHRTPIDDESEVADIIDDDLGVDISENLAGQISQMLGKVDHVPRGLTRPDRKSVHRERPIWRVLTKAGADGDVYMGVTINKSKFEVVQALHDDNQVVALSGANKYSQYASTFDWEKLKNIKLRSLDEQFPSLDDDTIEKWGTSDSSSSSSSNSSSSSSSGSSTDYDPKTRWVKVRTGTGPGGYSKYKGEKIHDQLDDGGSIKIGYNDRIQDLLVLKQTEGHKARSHNSYCRNDVGRVVVPNYVADYLLQAENTYASVGELRDAHEDSEVTCYDISGFLDLSDVDDDTDETFPIDEENPRGDMAFNDLDNVDAPDGEETTLGELDDSVLVLCVDQSNLEPVQEAIESNDPSDNILEPLLTEISSDVGSVGGMMAAGQLDQLVITTTEHLASNYLAVENWIDQPDRDLPKFVRTKTSLSNRTVETAKWGIQDGELFLNNRLPPELFPRDSAEWDILMYGGKQKLQNYTNRGQKMVETLRQLIDATDESAFISAQEDDDAHSTS